MLDPQEEAERDQVVGLQGHHGRVAGQEHQEAGEKAKEEDGEVHHRQGMVVPEFLVVVETAEAADGEDHHLPSMDDLVSLEGAANQFGRDCHSIPIDLLPGVLAALGYLEDRRVVQLLLAGGVAQKRPVSPGIPISLVRTRESLCRSHRSLRVGMSPNLCHQRNARGQRPQTYLSHLPLIRNGQKSLNCQSHLIRLTVTVLISRLLNRIPILFQCLSLQRKRYQCLGQNFLGSCRHFLYQNCRR